MENDTSVGERELTFGEKAVRLTFNPSGDERVNQVKQLYANIIDVMDLLRKIDSTGSNGEHKRLASVAITETQGACMWAVNALTWKD